MNLSDNEYFSDILSKYFLILIEINLYKYNFNRIYTSEHNDDKALGVYEAMKEMAELGEYIICVNFDPCFPVQKNDKITYISTTDWFNKPYRCDYIFFYESINNVFVGQICDYYTPKFIFHC